MTRKTNHKAPDVQITVNVNPYQVLESIVENCETPDDSSQLIHDIVEILEYKNSKIFQHSLMEIKKLIDDKCKEYNIKVRRKRRKRN